MALRQHRLGAERAVGLPVRVDHLSPDIAGEVFTLKYFVGFGYKVLHFFFSPIVTRRLSREGI